MYRKNLGPSPHLLLVFSDDFDNVFNVAKIHGTAVFKENFN